MNNDYNYTYKSTKKHHWPSLMSTFSSSLQGPFLVMFSRRSIQLFQALRYRQFLHIAFARDVDIDCGTLVSREPQTRRLCKHSLNFSLRNKYH